MLGRNGMLRLARQQRTVDRSPMRMDANAALPTRSARGHVTPPASPLLASVLVPGHRYTRPVTQRLGTGAHQAATAVGNQLHR